MHDYRAIHRRLAAYGTVEITFYDNFCHFRNANTTPTVLPGADLLGMNVGGISTSLKICIASCQLTRYLQGKRRRSALYPPPLLVKSEQCGCRSQMSVHCELCYHCSPSTPLQSVWLFHLRVPPRCKWLCDWEIISVSVFHDLFPSLSVTLVFLVSQSLERSRLFFPCLLQMMKTPKKLLVTWSLSGLTHTQLGIALQQCCLGYLPCVSCHVFTSYCPIKINEKQPLHMVSNGLVLCTVMIFSPSCLQRVKNTLKNWKIHFLKQ